MAKYSTGGAGGGGDSDACELCGANSDSLREATIAGARLQVCPSCAPHDDAPKEKKQREHEETGTEQNQSDRRRDVVRRTAAEGTSPMWDGDTSHWEEEGTSYDDDPLPYLVSNYGERLEEARQDAGYQREELAEELGVRESDLLAIEQGRATQAGIGGSLVEALEEILDVTLAEG